jgi:hypothetical protein
MLFVIGYWVEGNDKAEFGSWNSEYGRKRR